MIELDGDKQAIVDSSGRRCPRDIVQFVPFNKFNQNADILRA